MKILQELDPEGIALRKRKYLKRRVYQSKVIIYDKGLVIMIGINRVQIIYGT